MGGTAIGPRVAARRVYTSNGVAYRGSFRSVRA